MKNKWFRRTILIAVLGVGLYALFAYLTSFRATRLVNRLLNEWATGEVAEQSDSVYRLHVGRLHFNWALRRITLDSAVITTDSVRNALRSYPIAQVHGALRTCVISGVDIAQLVLGRGLQSTQIGCAVVEWLADSPPDSVAWFLYQTRDDRPRATPSAPPRPRISLDSARALAAAQARAARPLSSFQHRLRMPSAIPRIEIGRIVFPSVGARLVVRDPSGDRAQFDLARARLDVTNVIVNPADSVRADRPLFADNVALVADSVEFRPDTSQIVRAGHFEFDLTDSSIVLRDFEQGPRISDAEFQSRSPYRRDRIRVRAGSLTISGINRGAWAATGTIQARSIVLDSFRFEIRSDKRKPARPGPRRPKRSPQGFMAFFPRGIVLDTIAATNASVTYEEFAPRREQPGRLTLTGLDLLGLRVRHVPGRRSAEDTMLLQVRGRLMGQAPLEVNIEMPLDAQDFTMRVRGSVGAFDAAALNQLIEHIQPARVKSGRIDGVTFQYTVTNGLARGTLVPRYTNLAADITGEGMSGVLGSRVLGGLLRGAAEAAQGMKVHGSNPDKPGERPRVGTINHRFNGESLPAFFWNCIKSGLLPVVLK